MLYLETIDYMTLGTAPYHCQSGNLRIVGANAGKTVGYLLFDT
jgi:hypothetical protein